MARIEITDSPRDRELTGDELKQTRGGTVLIAAAVYYLVSRALSQILFTATTCRTDAVAGKTDGEQSLNLGTPGISEMQFCEQGQQRPPF